MRSSYIHIYTSCLPLPAPHTMSSSTSTSHHVFLYQCLDMSRPTIMWIPSQRDTTASMNFNDIKDRPKYREMEDTTTGTTEVSTLKQLLGCTVGWMGRFKRMMRTISSPPASSVSSISQTFGSTSLWQSTLIVFTIQSPMIPFLIPSAKSTCRISLGLASTCR